MFYKHNIFNDFIYKFYFHLTENIKFHLYILHYRNSYLFHHNRVARYLFPELKAAKNSEIIFSRIKKLHAEAPSKFKSSILALVANIYTLPELIEAGFESGYKQYRSALQKIEKNCFPLTTYSRAIPPSKLATSEETLVIIEECLQRYSRPSCITINSNEPGSSNEVQ